MPYDLFISYSRRDNAQDRVTQLIDRIKADFASFAERPLTPFFDVTEINGMEDWRHRILQGLRESRLLLACVSPAYLESGYCEWEFNEYLKHEVARGFVGDGVAPIYFVEVPGLDDKDFGQSCAEWVADLRRRNRFDLRPWFDVGEAALRDAEVRARMEQLKEQIHLRVVRGERAEQSLGNVDAPNHHFIGRVSELRRLRETVALGMVGVLTAVHGLGGMGKTALAIEYAHAFAHEYGGGRWQLRCEGRDDLFTTMAQLAPALGIEFNDAEKLNTQLQFERVLRELHLLTEAREPNRCLIVLDNVDQLKLLEPAQLQKLPAAGWLHVIATTRLGEHDLFGRHSNRAFVAVDQIPEDDAIALIEGYQPSGRFTSSVEREAAREIVSLVGGLTLAVEMAAVFLGQFADVSCADFLGRLKQDRLAGIEGAAIESTEGVLHGEKRLTATFQPTFSRLIEPENLALSFAALLPSDYVTLHWIRALVSFEFPEMGHDAEPGYPDPWLNVVRRLFSLRLWQPTLVVDGNGQPLVARMHRLVQELVTKREPERAEKFLDCLAEHAVTRCEFLKERWLEWPNRWEIEPLRALAESLLERNHSRATYLANNIGLILLHLARYGDAEPLIRRALAVDEQSFGPDHSWVALRLNNLAVLLKTTNRLTEAEPLMRRALAIDEQNLGPEHPSVAVDLFNLGHLLHETNRLTEAEPLMRRALAIDEQNLGLEHPRIARDLNNLASLLQDTNRLQEAEPLLRRALEIDEQSYGPGHPDVARDLNNLAYLLKATNRLTEAERLMRRALKINEQTFGPDHPDVAGNLSNLADLLQATNRLTEAEPLLRRALKINEQSFGLEHSDVAICLGNLGSLLRATNRLKEAEPLLRRVIQIFEDSYGLDHPKVATSLHNLASLLQDTNRLKEAELLLRRALEIDEQSYGPGHPDVARDLSTLALLLQTTNRPQEAEPLMRRSLAIVERIFGPDNAEVALGLNNLAHLSRGTNRMTEAEPLMRRSLAIVERIFGPDHPKVALRLNNLASLLHDTNRRLEAEPLMRRALAIDEQSYYGPGHPDVARDLNNLAHLLRATNRLTEAEPMMRRALAIDEQSYGPCHPDVARDLNNLAHLLQATNRLTEAEPLMRRALAIDEQSFGPDHPNVATPLNSLGLLLQATNRLTEAEPLIRRAVEIFLDFRVATGHEHRNMRTAINNYADLLAQMGRNQAEVLTQLDAVAAPFGWQFGP
jgi:tetratricopeptide (TPR) repeat protein